MEYLEYIYNKNAGIGKLRYIGLKNVSGNYVLFLDSDDFWSEGLLSNLSNRLDNYKDIDILRFNANRIEYKQTTQYELNKYKMQELSSVKSKEFFQIAEKFNIEIGPLWLYCYNANT